MEKDSISQDFVPQTALDQMTGSDQTQLLKAMIPYLPPRGQRLASIYAKAREFAGTVSLFSGNALEGQMQAAPTAQASPLDMINDISRYCYGDSKRKLNQITDLMAMIQMIQIMNEERQEG